ncbi:MAG: hypothetical protein AABY64_03875 [Bdellovibrionota bacterium]
MKYNKVIFSGFIASLLLSTGSLAFAKQSDFERGYNAGKKSCNQNPGKTLVQTYYSCGASLGEGGSNRLFKASEYSDSTRAVEEMESYPDSGHNLLNETCAQARDRLNSALVKQK